MKQKKAWNTVFGLSFIIIASVTIATFQISSLNSIKSTDAVNRILTTADKKFYGMTLRERVASLLILHASGNRVTYLKQFLDTYQPGGLLFMSDNIGQMTAEHLGEMAEQLQSNVDLPYLFAIDEEGGVVKRLNEDNLPAAADLKSLNPKTTKNIFRNRAELLKTAGMNLNFGIVADVTDDSNSFIYSRTFGGNTKNVSQHVASAVNGEKGLVFSTLKHYPGHGETNADSHFLVPTTNVPFEIWQKADEPPFIAGISAGTKFVMFGHLIYSAIDKKPASLSKTWHDLLISRTNFNGISITDDMLMLQQSGVPDYNNTVINAVAALNAGNTMLLYVLGEDTISADDLIKGISKAIETGEIDKRLFNDKVRRVLNLRYSITI